MDTALSIVLEGNFPVQRITDHDIGRRRIRYREHVSTAITDRKQSRFLIRVRRRAIQRLEHI